nr:FHA domain-containing protein [Fischerella sp. JS2]
MGRSNDCNPKLPNDEDHSTIFRYHCLLDINPPAIRVRDFVLRLFWQCCKMNPYLFANAMHLFRKN